MRRGDDTAIGDGGGGDSVMGIDAAVDGMCAGVLCRRARAWCDRGAECPARPRDA